MDDDSLVFADMADLIMEQVVARYAEANMPLPARRFFSSAETVHDCEQVSVTFIQAFSGGPGDQAQTPAKCNSLRSAVFSVEVVRCIPTEAASKDAVPSRYGKNSAHNVSVPDTDSLSDAAKIQMRDSYLLMDAALRVGESTVSGAIADVSAGDPNGGFQAMILSITLSAPGVEYYG